VSRLASLFAPSSVAVLGASADPAKWGYRLARGALRGSNRRAVYLVNRAAGDILGARAYPSLADLPTAPELVVVAVPAAGLESAVDEALAAGARAIVAISAGLGETGEEGAQRERAIVERVRAAGAVLLGPNCLGVADAGEELELSWNELPAGPIGLISQSGNLAIELARRAESVGLGVSRFASLGNQADLTATELLAELAEHDATKLIALYLEDFRDGRRFVAAAAATAKPILLLPGGLTGASARAARSHTGALVSGARAIEAACREAGILQVSTPGELVDAAQALLARVRPRGRRVAVYGDGGGTGIVAADVLSGHGLELPTLSAGLQRAIGRLLPPTAVLSNPVDLAGGGEQRLASFADVGRLLLDSGELDAVLLSGYFGGYAVDTPERSGDELEAARALASAAGESGAALLVHSMYPAAPAAAALRADGVPVYPAVEAAARTIALLAGHEHREPHAPAVQTEPASLPAPEPGYAGARALVRAAGIPVTESRTVSRLEEATAAANEIGYPVVLKAVDLSHKSDAGGVVLGLASEVELASAFRELQSRLEAETLAVERMETAPGIELIAGVVRDERFGPVVLAGFGGIYAEVFEDVAVALAPVGREAAERLLRSLRGAPLLEGARGGPPLDVAAAAGAVAALSRAAAACPTIRELEVNPLLATERGVVALDARVVLS
jgi:acetate---CoA ligase (ADP-forming)